MSNIDKSISSIQKQVARMEGEIDLAESVIITLRRERDEARGRHAELEKLFESNGDDLLANAHKAIDAGIGLRDALRAILEISRDRERFVLMGALGWLEAEQIAKLALGEAQP